MTIFRCNTLCKLVLIILIQESPFIYTRSLQEYKEDADASLSSATWTTSSQDGKQFPTTPTVTVSRSGSSINPLQNETDSTKAPTSDNPPSSTEVKLLQPPDRVITAPSYLFSNLSTKNSATQHSLTSPEVFWDGPISVEHPFKLFLNSSFKECDRVHRYCDIHSLDQTIPIFKDSTCSCREDCHVYGDCCWDAPIPTRLNGSKNDESRIAVVKFSCELVYVRDYEWMNVAMITSCPRKWNAGDDIRHSCEEPEDDDQFLKVPVTSKQTNFTYRNIFCAICHEDMEVVYWNLTVKCKQPKTPPEPIFILSKENSTDGGNATDTDDSLCNNTIPETHRGITEFHRLFLELSISETVKQVLHTCSNNDFKNSTCSDRQTTQLITQDSNVYQDFQRDCKLYLAPVKLRNSSTDEPIVYKNKYCAFCDGTSAEELQCYQTKPFWGFQVKHTPTVASKFRPQLSVIVDMNFVSGEKLVGIKQRCQHMQHYDPIKKTCRQLFCAPRFILKNGKCELRPTNTSVDHPQELPLRPIDICPRILRFLPHEFATQKQDENGTISVVAPGDVTLHEGQYLLEENGTVLVVCATDDNPYIDLFSEADGYLSIVGCSLSIAALLLKIGLYWVGHEQHNLPSKIVLLLSVSLLIAQLLFVSATYRTEFKEMCSAFGVVMHYAFLASFFWTNVLAYDIWKTFSGTTRPDKQASSRRRLTTYCIYGWGAPFLVVMIAVIFEWVAPVTLFQPLYGLVVCWISNRLALFTFFGCPLAALLVINMFFFIATVAKIAATSKLAKFAKENSKRQDRLRLVLYVKLALIMGLTWVFAFLAPFLQSDILRYLFIIFNSLQGLFILLAFTQFRKVCRPLMEQKNKLGKIGPNAMYNSTMTITTNTRIKSTSMSSSCTDESQITRM